MADPQDIVAQFIAVTDCEAAQAEQYLDVSWGRQSVMDDEACVGFDVGVSAFENRHIIGI